MRAMILAAGRGARMGSLTDTLPKPLLKVKGRYLIEYAIFSLLKCGINQMVINIYYHGEQIKAALGDGSRYGATFYYSEEKEVLETGGGIVQALPLLANEPFMVLSSDIITDYPLKNLPVNPLKSAHLVLVDNPLSNPRGDFCLQGGMLYRQAQNQFTFGNIGVYHPQLFSEAKLEKFRLGNLLYQKVADAQVSGEYYKGIWHNVGTPEDLELAQRSCFLT